MDYDTAVQIFDYNPSTGVLSWKEVLPEPFFRLLQSRNRFQTIYGGKPVGCLDSGGYLQVRWKGKLYLVHRIIWLLYTKAWPVNHIDHRDHNRSNNRIKNLRDVTKSKNNAHKKNNRSGHPCIFFQKRSINRPWMVQVYSAGSYVTQQSFADLATAISHRDAVRAAHNLPPI